MMDLELRALLIAEIELKLPIFVSACAGESNGDGVMRALHTLRGATGLAGERELCDAIARAERFGKTNTAALPKVVLDLLTDARDRLVQGLAPIEDTFPDLPPRMSLRTTELLPAYRAEIVDRLERIDHQLLGDDANDPASSAQAVLEVTRHLHSLKGAASALGDEASAWFCHNLEERMVLTGRDGTSPAHAALSLVRVYRQALGIVLLEQDLLQSAQTAVRISTMPPPMIGAQRSNATHSIRVESTELDDLLDRTIALVPHLPARRRRTREQGLQGRLREVRSVLTEALRIIGPARPWGTPEAAIDRIKQAREMTASLVGQMGVLTAAGEQAGREARKNADELQERLGRLRQTKLRGLFQRIASVIEVEAARTGVGVRVLVSGADEVIDRKLAEALVEPCMHIARNSVAHGLESMTAREHAGKSRVATVSLRGERDAGTLILTIQDDGSGVDVQALRARIGASRVLSAERLAKLGDDALLPYLLMPGLSLRSHTDALAGRGVGLDAAYMSVQRYGGTIRLLNRPGAGLSVQLHLPANAEAGPLAVLVDEGEEFAVPARLLFRVRSPSPRNELDGSALPPSLGEVLRARPRATKACRYVDLHIGSDDGAHEFLTLAVDEVRWAAGAIVRPLPPGIARWGPYRAAVVKTDGRLLLVLDLMQLATLSQRLGARAWRGDGSGSKGSS
jgi:two-component system, chemotaxis family, sensor kinase CheA